MSMNTSIVGHWEGHATAQGSNLQIRLHFTTDTAGSIDFPTWATLGWPLSNIVCSPSSVHFEISGDKHTDTFDGHIQGDILTGEFQFWTTKAQVFVRRITTESAIPYPYTAEDVQFQNGDVTLGGTIFLPPHNTPRSAILFTHGSGEDTRDRNRFLADYFARLGIASLIYDKRGTGASSGDWREADFDDLAADALAGVQFLKSRSEIDRIGLFGPSQGGWIITLAASHSKDVAFIITVCGPAVTPAQQSVYANQMRVAAGQAVKDVSNLKKEVLEFDPVPLLKTLSIPVLAVFGDKDKLVNTQESIAILESIRTQYGKDITIRNFPSANHNLMIFPEPSEPFRWFGLAEGYLETLADWTLEHTNVG